MVPELNGYKHLFLVSDFWGKVFRTPFYNWFSKNWLSPPSKALRNQWGIAAWHLQREQGFRGHTRDPEVKQVLSIPYAAATAAGVFLLLGVLAQNRGLAYSCQIESLKILERLCSCIGEKTFTVRILPDYPVEIKDLMVDMSTFWDAYPPPFSKTLKQRSLDCPYYCFLEHNIMVHCSMYVCRVTRGMLSLDGHLSVRWFNQAALGEWRTSADGTVPLHCFLWFLMRLPCQDQMDGFFPASRCQRRALHQVAQRIDDGLCADVHLSDRLRVENAALAPMCRQRSAMVKEELLRRFLARNAGFCGTANSANSDLLDFGLVDGKNTYGTTAAAHYVAVYWTQASADLKAAIRTKALHDGAFRFPSLAVYHNASDVCGKEVPWGGE